MHKAHTRYEVVEYSAGTRKIHLQTNDGDEAHEELRWLQDRKEQYDATMGDIRLERF